MDITVIGLGRLGQSVQSLLASNGIPSKGVSKGTPIPNSDVYYLTVPDHQIQKVATQIPKGKILIHASGAMDHSILRPHYPAAVLHPLMSFPGPTIAIPNPPIPASIMGDQAAVAKAAELAELLGFSAFTYNGDRRLYHAAAVTVGNFSTLLIQLAGHMFSTMEIDQQEAMKLLLPLATRSLQQACLGSLTTTLTGPISRSDQHTLQQHKDALSNVPPHLGTLYTQLVEATQLHLQWEQDKLKTKIK